MNGRVRGIRAAAAPAAPAAPLADEAGFGLIEVIVSALLVALVSLGVYLGIDGATVSAGINKHRTLATQLVQQDQDRMRAMAVDELSNYRGSTTQAVAGTTYTIASTSSWITDSTGAASCTSGTAQANYLRISSTVTWPGMQIRPVTAESLVAPPNGSFGSRQGSLAIQVRDRNGAGVAGVGVSLTGPASYTDVTNDGGCVLWGYLPASTGSAYRATISKTGYVDTSAVAVPSKQFDVIGEATTAISFDYDVGGRIQGNFERYNGTAAVATNGLSFSATNANLSVPIGPFGDGAPHASFLSPLVYPFSVGYAVYAGDCAGAQPPSPQTAIVTPGGTTNVSLRIPPVSFRVVRGTSTLTGVSGLPVTFTATGSGCSAVTTPTPTTDANGYIRQDFLYGTYAYCVAATSTTRVTGTLNNNSATGTTAQVNVSSATTGRC